MSATIIDLPKITQMLDAGWVVRLWKCELGSYTARAKHPNASRIDRANAKILASAPPEKREIVLSMLDERHVTTDDFTPEQALTRLAYKVQGEIL